MVLQKSISDILFTMKNIVAIFNILLVFPLHFPFFTPWSCVNLHALEEHIGELHITATATLCPPLIKLKSELSPM